MIKSTGTEISIKFLSELLTEVYSLVLTTIKMKHTKRFLTNIKEKNYSCKTLLFVSFSLRKCIANELQRNIEMFVIFIVILFQSTIFLNHNYIIILQRK